MTLKVKEFKHDCLSYASRGVFASGFTHRLWL